MKRHKFKIFFLIGIFFLQNTAFGRKLDWTTGYYSLFAKTPSGAGRISSFSYYQIAFRAQLLSSLELSVGYTLTLSKTFAGEYGYGPDMGLVYFPLTAAQATRLEMETVASFYQYEVFRPFISTYFHQRQFQSIQATYAGFSIGAGLEFWFLKNLGLRVLTQRVMLRGPLKATANEIDILAGLSYEF
jgi:hypothetical protein